MSPPPFDDLEPLDVARGVPVVVEIDGGRSKGEGLLRRATWTAVAHAPEPLRGIAVARGAGEGQWARSLHSWGPAIWTEVRSDDIEGGRSDARIASQAWPILQTLGHGEAFRRLLAGRQLDESTAVPHELGWHHSIDGFDLRLQGLAEEPRRRLETETGLPTKLLEFGGEHPFRLDLLLLPRRLTRTRRQKLWHVRPRHRSQIPHPWFPVLTHGRRGTWPPPPAHGPAYWP